MTKNFYDLINAQINSLKLHYPLDKFQSSLDYSRFFAQANYIQKKLKNGRLDEKQKKELMNLLDNYIKVVENYRKRAKLKSKSSNDLEEKVEKINEETKQPSTTQPTQTTTQSIPTETKQTQKYEPKGRDEAKKNYYAILGKIARLEAFCREITSENFSVKEFYKLLNEIENAFIEKKLHGDDSHYLWQKYKPLKENAKETLKKESESARKNIEDIVEKSFKEIEKGNVNYAKVLMFKTFELFKKSKLNKEDRSYCSIKIDQLKTKVNESNTEYKEKQEYYKNKAQEILNEIKNNESNPYAIIDAIKEIQIEMKLAGISKKDYKKINKILNESWSIASEKISLEKQKRQEARIEKKIRYLKELNEKRIELIEQTKREIAELRSMPFNPKIAEKESFIKELKKQIKETESKIRKLESDYEIQDSCEGEPQ
ncbi:MAG: hypothetical protein QW484_01575 [Candidatus Pacearchaeota archaeon]